MRACLGQVMYPQKDPTELCLPVPEVLLGKIKHLKKQLIGSWRVSPVGKEFALHLANPVQFLTSPVVPWAPPELIPEHRVRSIDT